MSDDNSHVAWCRYTDRSIVTCDSDEENAFRVYRHADDPDTIALFNQMADCLDDIRKMLGEKRYLSRMNLLQAIDDRINFALPDTPGDLLKTLQGFHAECEKYHAPRIAELERLLERAQTQIGDLSVVVGNIEQCRCVEGDSITILCDDPDCDSDDKAAAVEASGDYTGYDPQRFYGRNWAEALHKAAACSRNHYSENDDHE